MSRDERAAIIAKVHEEWTAEVLATIADDGPTEHDPHHPGGRSDYVLHLADMEATPDQEQQLVDRTNAALREAGLRVLG